MIYAASLSVLRCVPSWWFVGSRQWWLKGHIWIGSLSAVLVFFHSAFRLGGLLEQILWVLLVLVISTGIFGLLLQQILPHLLATRVTEIPYEQIPHECEVLRRKADAHMEMLCGPHDVDAETPPSKSGHPALDPKTKIRLRKIYESVVRQFLAWPYLRSSPMADLTQAEVVYQTFRNLPESSPFDDRVREELRRTVKELEGFCKDRRQLGEQERLHHWLQLWLLIHIPVAALLVVLGIIHGFVSMYF
jgi:hypothetical protein